jgi:signal transduction histidine kinase
MWVARTVQRVGKTFVTTTTAPAATDAAADRPAGVHVLFVEDSQADARMIEIELAGGVFDIDRVATLAEALARIAARTFDVVLLDLSLPDANGVTAFETIHAVAPLLPVVVLTGLDDDPTALALVHAGAQDYLTKDELVGGHVARSLRYAIERHRLRHELEAALKRESEQKDRFLAHVSHELRSPLAVSFLYTTNLLDGVVGVLTKEQHEHLTIAVDGLRAQMRLIDELLAAVRADARLIRVDRSFVWLQDILLDSVSGFGARPGGVTIVEETLADLPPVYVDRQRIRQVLTNLIDNALKASPPDGSIRVRTTRADEGFARVDVIDAGPGIPEDVRARMFDCLTHDGQAVDGKSGLGLGLYLSRLLVTRHGGRLWVESTGRGSCFSFTVPFSPPPEACAP